MSGRISCRSGTDFRSPENFLSSTSTQSGKADLGGHREGGLDAGLLLGLLAQADDVAGLALIGGDVDQLVVHRHALVAHQLARLGARDGEAHPIDHVVETGFQKLQQRLAGRARAARGLLVVVAELPLEHAVHAAQLLLLAQLQAVLGQALLALALHAARRHLELALRLERLRRRSSGTGRFPRAARACTSDRCTLPLRTLRSVKLERIDPGI